MKKLFIAFSVLFIFLAYSETRALTSFWYNWYALNNVGMLIPNQTVNVRIYIRQGSTLVYQELHTGINTDQFAIFAVEVGAGVPEGGPWNLASIVAQANTRIQADVQLPPGPYVMQTNIGLASVQVNNTVLPGNITLAQHEILIGNSAGDAEAQPVGGDLSGTNTGSVASLIINSNAVTNAKINSATQFLDVQNASGTSQFAVENSDRSLRFEGVGDVTVGFDGSTNKVSISYALPPLPPDISNEPFLVYGASAMLSNSKIALAGNAIEFIPGASDMTYNVLYDGLTIGADAFNKLYLMDNAVTASKISNDPATGDKLIEVINNAGSGVIDAAILPVDLVYMDTAPATGDIEGTFGTGLNISDNAVTASKISNDPATGDKIIQVINNAGSEVIDGAVLPGDLIYLDTTPASGDIDGTFGTGLNIVNDAVTTAKILDASVTYPKLQNATNSGLILVSNGAGNSWVEASVTSLETDPVWVAAEPNYGNLTQGEIITGDWINTANPWADNEVANNLTITGGTITNSPISGSTGSFTTLAASSTLTFSGLTAGNYPEALVVDNAGVVYKSPNQGSYSNIVDKNTNYSATNADGTILVDCSGGSRTITLPTAVTNKGLRLSIKKVDATVNSLVVNSAGGNIDGVATKSTIVPNQGFVFQSNGTNWFVVGIF